MSTDPRLFSLLDEFDDFPYNPSLRIPPLLDPLPFVPASRPSPLEPNARIHDGTHNATAKLTSRRKALAEAKLIGDVETAVLSEATVAQQDCRMFEEPSKRKRIHQSSRVNAFVRLPQPTAKNKETKPPPFEPVAILNELHEPPPSAALFPPITPNALPRGESRPETAPRLSLEVVKNAGEERRLPEVKDDSSGEDTDKETYGPIKRAVLRPRKKWTEAETQYLLRGVTKFGPGKWKKILNDPELEFSLERTTVDLKDRYRTCRMNQEKDTIYYQMLPSTAIITDRTIEVSSSTVADKTAFDPGMIESTPTTSQVSPFLYQSSSSPVEIASPAGPPRSFDFTSLGVRRPWLPPTRTRRLKDHRPKPPQPYRPHRTLPPRWTKYEDANLIKGYRKYGFQWTAITKDPEMQLSHRLGSQVRDRFRLKFSHLYKAASPAVDFEMVRHLQQPNRVPPMLVRNGDSDTASSADATKDQCAESGRTSIRGAREGAQSRSNPQPSSPTPYTPASSEMEPVTHLQQRTGQDSTIDMSYRAGAGLEADLQQIAPETLQLPDGGNRPSSATADDVRNLGITGLLNEDEEEVSRLPSFKYTYDDWGEDSVTLPPLLWEDMAARPIFDLDSGL